MKFMKSLLTAALVTSSYVSARNLCTASQKCWPSLDIWANFNSSIGGRLVAPRPPAWPCHDPNYDEAGCAEAKANWNSSFWRANQTGAMQDLVWESPGCNIDTPRNVTCAQGFVPTYSVAAQEASDVSKAVLFAGKHRLKLVVKNTGHDYLGRSSASGSLSIWTHLLKGINFTDSFVTTGCSQNSSGVPAVTIGAAEQWIDVYKAADDHKVIVVGGAANSVGAAGGWIQGGGHSPLGALYGMGVDNVLQFTVVKPNGKIVTANACKNKDLFWALRGGGGGTWGVTLDVTYKTHPPLDRVIFLALSLNTTSPQKLVELSKTLFQALPNITDQGVRGYGFWKKPIGFSLIIIHPNGPDLSSTNQTIQPIWDWISSNNGTQAINIGFVYPTFYNFFATWIKDVSIAVPLWMGTRLVSRKALEPNSDKLAKLATVNNSFIQSSINIVGGGAVSKAVPDSTGLNPQWRNDALLSWNIGSGWLDDTPADTIELIKRTTTRYTQKLGKIAGLDEAAYFNEADPGEPQWKKAFFGDHYDRLLKIKRQVDPEGLFTCNRCVGFDQ